MTTDAPDPMDVDPVDRGDPSTCVACGTAIPDDAAFCMACGTPVKTDVPETTAVVPETTAAIAPAMAPSDHRCATCGARLPRSGAFCTACGIPVPVPPAPPRSAWMPGWLWLLLGIVIVAGAGAAGFFGYRRYQAAPDPVASAATVGYLGEAPAVAGSPETVTSTTTTLPAGMEVVPDLGWMTLEDAVAIAADAGFTLQEGAGYLVASDDPRIGLVARTAPGAGAPAATTETVWAELGIDGGAEVRVHPGDLGVVPTCTATGGALPDGVALGIGGDRLACTGDLAMAAGSPFFIRAWWVQPGWPDFDVDRVSFTIDGVVQPAECTGSWSAGSVAGSCAILHDGLAAGPHELVVTHIVGGEPLLVTTVSLNAG